MQNVPSQPEPTYDRALVALTLDTLSHFGGLDSLDRDAASALLSMWKYAALLSDDERVSVLARFPAPTPPAIPSQVDGKAIGTRITPVNSEPLTAAQVTALLSAAGVDLAELTITDDPAVWTNIESGEQGTSVRIDGPKHARRAATAVLWEQRLAQAPYPDHDYWSR